MLGVNVRTMHGLPDESETGQIELDLAERGLGALIEACERAAEEIGAVIPQAQLRALMIIDRAGRLNLSQLATAVSASASATSRLCDRMEQAGLITRDRDSACRREIVLLPAESGRRLAEWVRGRRRAALANLLETMTPDGREALARGLDELAVAAGGQAAAKSA